MNDAIGAIGTIGFPIVLILVVFFGAGRFLDSKLWPFVTQALRDWQAAEQKRMERSAVREDRLVTVIESNTKAMQEMVSTTQTIRAETSARLEALEKRHSILARRMKRHLGEHVEEPNRNGK